jgi:penicillin-insensitive murein DD-endopeptidase
MNMPSPLTPEFTGSVGAPSSGVLTESVELPVEGAGFRRYRSHDRMNFGVPRLVEAITGAAEAIRADMPASPRLIVGDLSAETGGRIPRHQSHRSGRDVDLLFYVTTPEGIPVESPGFVSLGADGLGRLQDGRYVRLDVEREWRLVKELMARVNVQFMFISRDFEVLIIQYALARGEPLDLIWHAETVLFEPPDSLPHTDHIHLRVACAPSETIRGCSGGGPYWPWLDPLPADADDLRPLLQQIAADDALILEPEAPPDAPSEQEPRVVNASNL